MRKADYVAVSGMRKGSMTRVIQNVLKTGGRYDRNPVVERIRLVNWRNDVSRVWMDRVERTVCALADGWRCGGLAFQCDGLSVPCHDEIHFRPGGSTVEGNVRIGIESPQVRQYHLFPAAAKRRMPVKLVKRLDAKKCAGQSGVAEIDLGCLHKALSEIGCERRDHIYHERLLEKVDVSADRHVGHAKRRRKAGVVDHLRILVCKHPPKTVHRLGHELAPEQEIAFKERLDEGFDPVVSRSVIVCKIGAREAAAEKALRPVCSFEFAEEEWRQPLVADSPSQSLRALAKEFARSGAEDKKVSVATPVVAKTPEYREQVSSSLYFVDADKFSGMAGEEQFRVGELCEVGRPFEVEIDGIWHLFAKMLYQCGFPALARPNHGGHRISRECPPYIFLKQPFYVCFHIDNILAYSTASVEITRIIIAHLILAVNAARLEGAVRLESIMVQYGKSTSRIALTASCERN